ncbi:MAG: heavy-metal-associated domain-containing protein [Bacteroidales bacterium]
MVFFAFSFLASIFGGLSAGRISGFSYQLTLAVDGPYSRVVSMWPFIVVLVLLLLTVMWYQAIKNHKRRKGQTTSVREKHNPQSFVFVGIVTVFAVILMAAPWYIQSFDTGQSQKDISEGNRTELVLTVHGMDCGGCESLVQRRVGALDGVESVAASHTREEVYVVYDKSKLSEGLIAQTIEESGYTVVMQ